MLRYIYPRIAWADLRVILVVAVLGAWTAGVYGALHDQITFTISPQYFTNLKFQQFAYADLGFSDRLFVAQVGFLGTWWVGFFIAWFLGRKLIPNQPRRRAVRQIAAGFAVVSICGLLAGLFAYALGVWRGPFADYSNWEWAFEEYAIVDTWSFVRVAYIHNAGYAGGLLGLLISLGILRPVRIVRLPPGTGVCAVTHRPRKSTPPIERFDWPIRERS
jgi:hypothetical protein